MVTSQIMKTLKNLLIVAGVITVLIVLKQFNFINDTELQMQILTYLTPNNPQNITQPLSTSHPQFVWTDIPLNELQNHFTQYELSSMKFGNKNISDLVCPGFIPNYCCIGSSSHGGQSLWNKNNVCLKRNYKIKLYNYQYRTAFTTFDLLTKLANNSNIIIIGDSVQEQIMNGFECDVIRHKYYPFNKTKIQIYTIHENPITNWRNISFPTNYHYQNKVKKNISYITVGKQHAHVINLLFINAYRPYSAFFSEEFCKWGNIYLFSWEFHYKPDLYFSDWEREIGNGIFKLLQKCFDGYKLLTNKPIFIWNEGTAQHFGFIGGDWFDIYGNNKSIELQYRKYIANLTNNYELGINDTLWNKWYFTEQRFHKNVACEPHHFFKDVVFETHFRRIRMFNFIQNVANNISFDVEIVSPHQTINKLRENTLYFIPFKDVTDPLYELHADGDCTHYCTTPYLWQFIWDSMYRIAEKNY